MILQNILIFLDNFRFLWYKFCIYKYMEKKFEENLDKFLRHVDCINDALPMTMLLMKPYHDKAIDKFVNFLNENVKEIKNDKGKKRVFVKVDQLKLFNELESNASIASISTKIIPKSLFVSLISQYDAFLYRLLKVIFDIKPEILYQSEKSLNYSQIAEKRSIKELKEYIVDSEIETFLRSSHSDQFDSLEKKLDIKLREGLLVWPQFIEITERRNLLVHCGGIVSTQYIKNCSKNKCNIEKINVGDELPIDPGYFVDSCLCLKEIAIKLTHTLWRKFFKNNLMDADAALNNMCVELIDKESFKLADTLLSFATKQKHHFDEVTKNLHIINLALSKYLQGKKEEAKKILDANDWSACKTDFCLAYEILNDNYVKAYKIMEKIGKRGEIKKSDYREWPLFKIIRKEKKFKETYKKIFKEEYSIIKIPMRPAQEIINKEIKNSKKSKGVIFKGNKSKRAQMKTTREVTNRKSVKK